MRKWQDDPYTKKARKLDYEARSAFKLEEIDQRENLVRKAQRILDLGASPGSWTQYCLRHNATAKIWAIDIKPLNITDPRVEFREQSIEDLDISWFGGEPMDLVLSDMAPKTTGVHEADVAQSLGLAEMALETCSRCLKKGGNFIVKVFMGEGFQEYEKAMKTRFAQVRLLRPDSTRKHSREIFFIGKGFKGGEK